MSGTHLRSFVLVALSMMLLTLPVSASQDDGTQEDEASSRAAVVVLPPTFPVYLVPYMSGGAFNSIATVVSITNLGTTSCATSVDWKIGAGGVACTTSLTLRGGSPVGDTLDHCTNPNIVGCNATCPQPEPFGFRSEGAAIVRAEAHCRASIGVDARIYYSNSDGGVAGVADLKVIKLPGANKGE